MKKVLVTGADGFIGSHLTEELIFEGCEVRALSVYNSFNDWGWLEDVHRPGLTVINGDVRDPAFCMEAVRGCDTVFHLAALIAIPYSYVAPDSYVDTNIKGTLNICQAARAAGVERLIVTSTSEVYGTAQRVPIDETHPKQPQSPYSATKIGADAIAESFYHAFGLPVVVARPFNTYGPRQSARAIIPSIIFIALAKTPNIEGQEINICSKTEISMSDLFSLIAALMHADVKWIQDPQRVRPKNSEVFRLFGDNTKIQTLTNWRPRYTLAEGLKETIAWFTQPENLAKYKYDIYNR